MLLAKQRFARYKTGRYKHNSDMMGGTHNEKIGAAARLAPITAAFIAYLAVSLVIFYPVVTHPTSTVPGSGITPYQDMWMTWWSAYAVLSAHSGIYHTTLLSWPLGANLYDYATAPILSLAFVPFLALGAAVEYNIIFLVGFALSGICMYVLAEYLSSNKYAAFIAGLIFAFSSFHIAESSHLSMLFIGWLPISVFFLMRMMRHEASQRANVAGLSLSLALSSLTASMQLTVLTLLVVAAVVVAGMFEKAQRSKLLSRKFAVPFGVSLAIAFIIGSWSYIPLALYLSHNGLAGSGYYPNMTQYMLWSDNAASYFVPGYYNGLAHMSGIYGSVSYLVGPDPSQRPAYIGYSVLALALYGAYIERRRAALWIVIGIVAAWLSLGPFIQMGSAITKIPGIYMLYAAIPYLKIVREPARFGLLVTFSASLLACMGASRLLSSKPHARRRTLAISALAGFIILVEIATPPLTHSFVAQTFTNVTAPQPYAKLSNVSGNYSVLSLPVMPVQSLSEPNLYAAISAYYTSVSKKRAVGAGFTMPNSTERVLLYDMPLAVEASNLSEGSSTYYSSLVDQNLTNQTLLTLYNYNTGYITILTNAYTKQELGTLNGYMGRIFGAPYNGTGTETFGTAYAINQSIYESYVAYPVIVDWLGRQFLVNGSLTETWSPLGNSPVIVYAPYPNATARANGLYNGETYYALANMSFYAFSERPGTITIAEQNGTSVKPVAAINLTGTERFYSVYVPMVSGPRGNTLFLLPSNSTGEAYLSDMRFSKAG